MSDTVEIFYSYQSPYSYLALDDLYELQRRFDVTLLWQPFSAKASGQQSPTTAVNPDKLSYLFEDTKRFAEERGLPLCFPEGWPENEFDPGRITRGALIANDMGILMEYNYKVYHKCWGLGENPNDENFMSELCEELDVDLAEFLSKMSSSDTRERVKGVYRRGRKHGVFDTPTFLLSVDSPNNEEMARERIVGLDKIPYLAERLKKLGLEKKS
jgi:2-hydroxychromene-2-carboxylate isomerase